jgi:peptide/nickel transport system permease protein
MAESQTTATESGLKRTFRALGQVSLFFRRWPVFSLLILTLLVITGIFAPLLAPYDPIKPSLADRNTKPFWYPEYKGKYLLGGDQIGRDVLSRLIHGARISLIVMSVSISSGLLVGTAMGLLAGYMGGIVDEIITRLVDIWLSIPFILIAMVVVIVMGQSFTILVGLLAMLAWVPFVRNVRAETLSLKTRDYVALAKVSGASTLRILIRHILPGVINTIMVIATLRVGQLIMTESILSFLGAGIPPPTPSWGVCVNDGRNYISDAWWISFFPGVAILIIVMAFNFIGDWMRDRFDPRLRQL